MNVHKAITGSKCECLVWKEHGGKQCREDCGEPGVVMLSNWYNRTEVLCRAHAKDVISAINLFVDLDGTSNDCTEKSC